ncbi:MAG TPA: hypothetical protein VKR53_00960 [Puia sp.]|nr:hypothetical protein [Puia sp.]
MLQLLFCITFFAFNILIVTPPSLMQFTKLHTDCNCDCTENCRDDTQTSFAIKTTFEKLDEIDFKSYWEMGRRDSKSNSCHAICALKAQSMSIMTEATKDVVKDIFKQIFRITPGYIQYLAVIKFNDNCGMVKASPSKRNPHHYDFLKCDDFKIENVELISSVNLHDENV